MVFIETSVFTKLITKYLSDDESIPAHILKKIAEEIKNV
jgi:hypothetical protein